jgi:molybdopterin synthase sulfur carrier subunit
MKILYFAWLRERIGTGEETVALPDDVTTVAELTSWLMSRSPGHASALAQTGDGRRIVRCAVNQEFAGPETRVTGRDEVAFFPPVTGG